MKKSGKPDIFNGIDLESFNANDRQPRLLAHAKQRKSERE
jgi:hypothetical protein